MEAPVYEIKEVFEIEDKTPVRYRRLRFIIGHGEKTYFMFPQYLLKGGLRLACRSRCAKHCKATLLLTFADNVKHVKVDKPHLYEFASSVSTELLLQTSTYSPVMHQVSLRLNFH